jgi:hypothetical protein
MTLDSRRVFRVWARAAMAMAMPGAGLLLLL